MLLPSDLIAAIATPAGIGGVGIVRVSGPGTIALAEAILGFLPNPRMAHFSRFRDARGEVIDEGIALFSPTLDHLLVKMYWSCRVMEVR